MDKKFLKSQSYLASQPYDFIDENDNLWSIIDNTSNLFIGREVILKIQNFNQKLKCNIVSFNSNKITVKIDKKDSKKIANWLTKIVRSDRPSQFRYYVSGSKSRITFIDVEKDYSNGMVLYICIDDDDDDDDEFNVCKGMIN